MRDGCNNRLLTQTKVRKSRNKSWKRNTRPQKKKRDSPCENFILPTLPPPAVTNGFFHFPKFPLPSSLTAIFPRSHVVSPINVSQAVSDWWLYILFQVALATKCLVPTRLLWSVVRLNRADVRPVARSLGVNTPSVLEALFDPFYGGHKIFQFQQRRPQ